MPTNWDFVAYGRGQDVVLIVEVKRNLNANAAWAAALRSNVLDAAAVGSIPYFLVVCPKQFFLWRNGAPLTERTLPSFSGDPSPIFLRYLDSTRTVEELGSQSLELIVNSWLLEVLHKTKDQFGVEEKWIVDSGLSDALQGARLDHEIVA